MIVSSSVVSYFANDPIVYMFFVNRNLIGKRIVLKFEVNGNEQRVVAVARDLTITGMVMVDIADLVSPYLSTLYIDQTNQKIGGYATFRLVAFRDALLADDSFIAYSDVQHVAIKGSIGELNRAEGKDIQSAIIANNAFPLLSAHQTGSDTAQFYASELSELEMFLLSSEDGSITLVRRGQHSTEDYSDSIIVEDDTQLAAFAGADIVGEDPSGYRRFTLKTGGGGIYYIDVDADPDTDESHLFRFVNKYGVYDAVLFTGILQNNPAANAPDTYYTSNSYLRTRLMQRRILTEKYVLNTGFIDSMRLDIVKQMLQSEMVQIRLGDDYVDCIVSANIDLPVVFRQPQSINLEIEILQPLQYQTITPLS